MSELIGFLCDNVPQFRKSRLSALYSDFSYLRTTNPDGYVANVSAWLQGLASATRAGVMPTINKNPNLLSMTLNQDLIHALETENGRPLSIGIVSREGIANGQLIPRKEFMEAVSSIYQKSWSSWPWYTFTHFLKQFGNFRSFSRNEVLPVMELVVLENLEAAAKEAKKKFLTFNGRSEKIFSRAAFVAEFGSVLGPKVTLSDSDMELFLKFLARDLALISYNPEIVKLRSQNETDAISLEDVTIASLKKLIGDLNRQITALTHKCEELNASAKVAVSKNNKTAALAALRSKNLTTKTLEKRYITMGQLEEVFSKIEQASDQLELIQLMQASTRVLSSLNKESKGPEEAENIIEKLQEHMQLVDEFDINFESGFTVDESELDLELEAIERDEKEQKEANEQAMKLQAQESETKLKLKVLESMDRQSQTDKIKPSAVSEIQKEVDDSSELLKNLSLGLEASSAE
ncbi:uncharacterized protein GcM1_249213 [Golovinomyces cichoracearum]|uniref:Snf7 family protein n=1 Tax=Golovinomyces cichoracearum TaxID=62708 RepID=A0A420IC58_9PEZI|nr:uncharacterized protein GcM1_249213 [Golovinomyces cichoracearum]